jgi:hypothetical protein
MKDIQKSTLFYLVVGFVVGSILTFICTNSKKEQYRIGFQGRYASACRFNNETGCSCDL